jgi:hypothetical protein
MCAMLEEDFRSPEANAVEGLLNIEDPWTCASWAVISVVGT